MSQAPQPQHDGDSCGLDLPGDLPLCPGCAAEAVILASRLRGQGIRQQAAVRRLAKVAGVTPPELWDVVLAARKLRRRLATAEVLS